MEEQKHWDCSRTWALRFAAGMAAVTFLVYAPSLTNAFVALDDGLLIVKNPLVHRIAPYTLGRIFTSYDPELYIPFTLLLYQIQYAFAGANPVVFHFTNLILHIGNALLATWLMALLTRKRFLGLAAGLLFALHPLHTEAVAWASATKDLLSAFFFLLSFILYIRSRQIPSPQHQWLSVAAFFAALLSKVVVLLLPALLLLYDLREDGKITRRKIIEKWPYIALSGVFLCIALAGKAGNPLTLTPLQTLLMAGKSTAFYAEKLLLPAGLSAIYPQLTEISIGQAEFFIPVLAVLLMMALWIWSLRRQRSVSLALGLFFLPLLPNFVNFSKNGYLFFGSDRYAYLASLGVLLLLALAIRRFAEKPRGRIALGAGLSGLAVIFAIATFAQSRTWRDTESLYRNALRRYPDSTMALNNLGSTLMAKEKDSEALELFTRAHALDGRSVSAVNIGLVHLQRGGIEEAETWFASAVEAIPAGGRLNAGDIVPYYFLADLREKLGRPEEALALYKEAAERGAGFAEPHINLGIAYQKRQLLPQAQDAFQSAIAISPNLPAPHYHLAGILAETGYLEEAERELLAVLRIDPHYENAARHLANIRALSPTL